MLHPRLANLLEAIIVARSTAHSIEILGSGRMVCIWHREKIHHRVSGVARGYSYRQAALGPGSPIMYKSAMFPAMTSGPGLKPSGALCADWGAEFPELLLKSKSSGSVK